MINYIINPKEHSQGGKVEPYQLYHTTSEEHEEAIRLATDTLDGLLPSVLAADIVYVDVPTSLADPGVIGQRAIDENYAYYYTSDGWKRAALEDFDDSSSSSSISSSSSSESSEST